MKTYEAMFLLDPALASDFPTAEGEIKRILDRAEAELLGLSKWDERKLAYPIRNHKRGLYVLCYFKADSSKIAEMERDVRLSESMIRTLILVKEGMTAEQIEKALASTPATEKPVSRPDDLGRGRDRDKPADAPPAPTDAKNTVAVKDSTASDKSDPDAATEAAGAASATAVAEATDEDEKEPGS